jgi:REP element-mobilizing transposase RayT
LTLVQVTAILIGMKQVALALPEPRTWGGRRKGAGRKPARPGARIPHTARPWHDRVHPVHVTFRVVRGIRLRDFAVAREIGTSFRAMVGGAREEEFRILEFCLLDDHVHLIIEARDRRAFSRGMQAVAIRLAKAVNRALGRRNQQVIQERYHAHVLRTPTEVRNALRYVMLNGRKHGAPDDEFVDGLDSRSSARWSTAWRDHRPDPSPPPVSRPRTHLARSGWRKHGLLEISGGCESF